MYVKIPINTYTYIETLVFLGFRVSRAICSSDPIRTHEPLDLFALNCDKGFWETHWNVLSVSKVDWIKGIFSKDLVNWLNRPRAGKWREKL